MVAQRKIWDTLFFRMYFEEKVIMWRIRKNLCPLINFSQAWSSCFTSRRAHRQAKLKTRGHQRLLSSHNQIQWIRAGLKFRSADWWCHTGAPEREKKKTWRVLETISVYWRLTLFLPLGGSRVVVRVSGAAVAPTCACVSCTAYSSYHTKAFWMPNLKGSKHQTFFK